MAEAYKSWPLNQPLRVSAIRRYGRYPTHGNSIFQWNPICLITGILLLALLSDDYITYRVPSKR